MCDSFHVGYFFIVKLWWQNIMVYKLLIDLLLWKELFLDSKRSKNTLLLSCAKHWFVFCIDVLILLLSRVFCYSVYICFIAFVTKLILYLCWYIRFSLRIMDTYLYNKALLAIKIAMTCICLPETLFGIKLITKIFRF